MPLAPSFTNNGDWLHPHSLGSSWPNTLMELPWVLRRAPPSGMVVVEGARRDTGTVPRALSANFVVSGSFPKPETTPTPISPGRSNKGAVGCVTTMVHNHYHPPQKEVPPPPELQPRSSLPQVRPWLQPPTVRDLGCTGKPRLMLIWGSTRKPQLPPFLQSPSETIAKGDLEQAEQEQPHP